MINVYINRTQNVSQLIVLGHAGFDEAGKDIVCAGVSTLAQSYAQCCIEKAKCNVDVSDGRLEITVEDTDDTKAMLEMLEKGVSMISEAYENHVTLVKGTSIM